MQNKIKEGSQEEQERALEVARQIIEHMAWALAYLILSLQKGTFSQVTTQRSWSDEEKERAKGVSTFALRVKGVIEEKVVVSVRKYLEGIALYPLAIEKDETALLGVSLFSKEPNRIIKERAVIEKEPVKERGWPRAGRTHQEVGLLSQQLVKAGIDGKARVEGGYILFDEDDSMWPEFAKKFWQTRELCMMRRVLTSSSS